MLIIFAPEPPCDVSGASADLQDQGCQSGFQVVSFLTGIHRIQHWFPVDRFQYCPESFPSTLGRRRMN